MDLLQAIVLALIQGLTEILPISSSGHLVLVPHLLGWPDQGLAYDVALHVGTLFAVMTYFRREVVGMLGAWTGSVIGRRPLDGQALFAWRLVLATIPAAIAGLAFNDFIETNLRSPLVIVFTLIGFGLLLGWADRRAPDGRSELQTGWRDALIIGCAQALALIPGTSRSGITMTAGRFLGLSRIGAARFSFLMSIPVILLAGGYKLLQLALGDEPVAWGLMAVGMAVAFLSTLVSIHVLLRLVQRIGFMPFVIYRLALGGALIVIFY
ncbi:MAG: undecaprenyl-diphosphate phosphatase [Pseudomonadota bacterium]|nr:undecaprenyl-diphosphate phosphatase [Pseudomonadota bacterium]